MGEYGVEVGPAPAQSGWIFMATVYRGDTYIRSAYGTTETEAVANLRWNYPTNSRPINRNH
jgi:hypothetical protein